MAEAHPPHAPSAPDPGDNPAVTHEASDVNIRGIFAFALGLTIATIFVSFLVWMLFQFYAARENQKVAPEFPLATEQQHRLPPEPRLQTNPRQDLTDLRAQEDRLLTTYGWVDKNAGVVRIPIEEAMKTTVQRGLPARKQQ